MVPLTMELVVPCGTTETVALEKSLKVETTVPVREPKLVSATEGWTIRMPVGLRL